MLGSKAPPWRTLLPRLIIPISIVLIITAVAMGYYNGRVFGSPWTLPYQINRATYAVSPVFIWESPGPEPLYRHKVMRDFYVSWELPVFEKARTARGFLVGVATKFGMMFFFFFGAVLTLPLIMLPRVFRDRRTRFLVLTGFVFFLGLLANAFTVPHYFGPLTCVLYALLIQAMRHLRMWRPAGQPVGRFLVRVIPAVSVVLCVAQLPWIPVGSASALARAAVQQQLAGLPGRQLAIVRYEPGHKPVSVEWVYNAADIDSANVVWAREMSPAMNRELIDYFKDRQVWLVEPDCTPAKVSRYSF
jgi:hypothetical protein